MGDGVEEFARMGFFSGEPPPRRRRTCDTRLRLREPKRASVREGASDVVIDAAKSGV